MQLDRFDRCRSLGRCRHSARAHGPLGRVTGDRGFVAEGVDPQEEATVQILPEVPVMHPVVVDHLREPVDAWCSAALLVSELGPWGEGLLVVQRPGSVTGERVRDAGRRSNELGVRHRVAEALERKTLVLDVVGHVNLSRRCSDRALGTSEACRTCRGARRP